MQVLVFCTRCAALYGQSVKLQNNRRYICALAMGYMSLTKLPNFANVAILKFVLVGGLEAGHYNNPAETKQEPGQTAV